jgi:hypothetical protein
MALDTPAFSLANLISRSFPGPKPEATLGPDVGTTTSSSGSTKAISGSAATALAVVLSVVILCLCITGIYFLTVRRRKPEQTELEVGEDGQKIKMVTEQRRWWRRGSGESQDELVPDVKVPTTAHVHHRQSDVC